MDKFGEIYQEILRNKDNHDAGYYNCIPFTGLDRLEHFIPGIEKGTYYLITANSGIGKSKLARYLFLHQPFEFVKNNPDSNIKVDILYFTLEESKKKIILSEVSKYLYTNHDIIASVKDLQSIGRYNTLSRDIIEKVGEAENYVNNFLKSIHLIDNIRNPTGIYKYVRDFALEIGTYYDKQGRPFTPDMLMDVKLGKGDTFKKVDHYKTHHPNHYVIVIVDHISLLDSEKYNDKFLSTMETMELYSKKYCLHMRDKFGFIPVNVQQQAADQEKVQYDYRGVSVDKKLEPSLAGLGDSKKIARDVNIAFGLFSPDRYSIEKCYGYEINKLKDNFRLLTILKDRDGPSNNKVPLFFNGAVEFFKELPKPDDAVGMTKVYKYLQEIRNKK